MKKHDAWKAVLVSVSVISISISGFLHPVIADEKKEIPDHAGFQSCKACHAQQQSMWEASNHGKAIRLVVHNDPAATDCSGCHSSQRSEAIGQGTRGEGAKNERFHQVSCLACHTRPKSEYDHRLVMDPEKL